MVNCPGPGPEGKGRRALSILLILMGALVLVAMVPTGVAAEAPKVLISYPLDQSTFRENEDVELNATNSFDPDGTDVTIRWSSNKDGDLGTGPVKKVKLSPGGHIITCEVVDGDGEKASENRQVMIIPLESPIARLDADRMDVEVFQQIHFSAARSEDPDFNIERYKFDFGDGTPSEWVNANAMNHSFSFPGEYTVRLDVKDRHGLTDSTNITIIVRGKTEVQDNTDEDRNWLIWLFAFLVSVVIVLLVVFHRTTKRRKRAEEAALRRRLERAGTSKGRHGGPRGDGGHKVKQPRKRTRVKRRKS